MKNLLLSKQAKIFVDVLLIVGLVLSCKFYPDETSTAYWKSAHCIVSVAWFLLTIIHVFQHWKLIKAFTKKNIRRKNKITAITVICFILMVLSITFFISGQGEAFAKFHHVVGNFYMLMAIIHVIQKFKKLKALLPKNETISTQTLIGDK